DLPLEELEREFTLQQQITAAARKLVLGAEPNTEQQRKRKQVHNSAFKRLQELEDLINEYRINHGKKPLQRASRMGICVGDCMSVGVCMDVTVSQLLQLQGLIFPLYFSPSALPGEIHSSSGKAHVCSLLPDRSSPPKSRELRGFPSSPNSKRVWKLSPEEIYYEILTRRNSLASPTSPNRTFPRSSSTFEGRSVPATPVLSRNIYSSYLRPEGAGYYRQWSDNLDSQVGFPLEASCERPDLYTARTRRSNSSEALMDRSPGFKPCSPDRQRPNGLVRPPFKSSEALSDRSSSQSSGSSGNQPPKPAYHLVERAYEQPAKAKPARMSSHHAGDANKHFYNELLLEYFLEKQQAKFWGDSEGRGLLPPTQKNRFYSYHHNPPSHQGDGHACVDSPQLRSRGEVRRGKVARTKSCGPYVAVHQEPPSHQQRQEVVHPPPDPHQAAGTKSRGYQRSLVPEEVTRNSHRALALEGLRDWYIRNATGHRAHWDRKQPQLLQDQFHLDQYYCSPIPHSVSFNGPTVPFRHYEELVYPEDMHGPFQDLSITEQELHVEKEVTPPGTLV
uniref:Coiled-coil domain containing 120 n=1 Tax=Latimeria chalumnae TaxID=7897 RepID=H3A1F3_LATCH